MSEKPVALGAVEARAAAALPGPWEAEHAEHGAWSLTATLPGPGERYAVLAQRFAWEEWATESRATGEFIAHSREDVLALAAEVRRLREALAPFAEAAKALDGYRGEQPDRLVQMHVNAADCKRAKEVLG